MCAENRKEVQDLTNIADVVWAVLAVYPKARAEFPSQLCSISEYPKGPEVSRRCVHPRAAWFDALRSLPSGKNLVPTEKGSRKGFTSPAKLAA